MTEDTEYQNERCSFDYLATAEEPCWGEVEIVDECYHLATNEVDEIWACKGHEDLSWPGGSYIPRPEDEQE